MHRIRQRAWFTWAFAGLLALLCGVMAVVQNRWISEISLAQQQRLQQDLQSDLNRLSREFNAELTRDCTSLLPSTSEIEELGAEKAYAAQYARWRDSHDRVFSRIALAIPKNGELVVYHLDLATAQFKPGELPAEWSQMRDRMRAREGGGRGPGPGRGFGQRDQRSDSLLIEMPRFANTQDGPGPPRPIEQEWLLAELNVEYARTVLLPELLHRYLGGGGKLDYQAEVVAAANPSHIIFQSTPGQAGKLNGSTDASVNIFDVNDPSLFRRPGDQSRRRPPGPPPDGRQQGRWRMLVRHEAGSLEAVVSRARWQNVAVSIGILLLILVTAMVLVRFSRRTQQLAELQMNFVAGISHEFRTPLTVIRTAAYNLRGRMAAKPEQVEKYGELIQEESEKLAQLVEHVLRFAATTAGHVIRAREPVAVAALIEQGLRSSRAALAGPDLVVEKNIPADLTLVLADELAMKHAVQNLVDNALKYGTEGSNWIGISAAVVHNGKAVELRVADRGPGIPLDEQEHLFDPFFRGRQAIQDQIHGTGLGLNLVKKIVEAHGGSIRVHSAPMQGTEFVLRIPSAPPELQNEFAHSPG